MTKTLSSRQTGVLVVFLLFANKILVLPSLLYERSHADGFFVILILLAFELALLGIFLRLKRLYPTDSFYEIIQKKLGTFLAKGFYVIIILYFFYKVMLLFNISYMYFHLQVYIDASYYIFIFSFLVIMTSSALKGINVIARGLEFFYIFVMTSLILCIGLSFANFRKFPLFVESTPSQFFSSIFNSFFAFGDMLILFVIMDKIEFSPILRKKVLVGFFISASIILFIYFMFYSIFGLTSIFYKNAVSDIITFSYRFIDLGRVDLVAIITVMFLSFFQLSIYCFAFCTCFRCLFPPLSQIYAVAVFDIAFIAIVLTSAIDYLVALKMGETFMPYIAILLQLILPLIMLIICRRKKT